MLDEQARGRTRSRNRDADLQPAVRRRPPQFPGNRPRIAEQPRQAAQVKRDLARAAYLDARRELARHALQHGVIRSLRRIQRTEHDSSPWAVNGHRRNAGVPVNPPAWRYDPNLCFKPGHTMAAAGLLGAPRLL